LVRVAHGTVFDVAVDVRRSSPNLGRWTGVELSAANNTMMWIPEGFAHGFLTVSEEAVVVYKASAFYSPDSDRVLRWDDPEVGIKWPAVPGGPTLSTRDAAAPLLEAAELFE
jgi:dTDP-4-dehydrorhamnose 3,5-epimerase